jgi:hypothetical protein
MEALARLGLFGFGYIAIYVISNMVASTNEQSGLAILENFHGVSFLLVTIILGGWIYFTHFKDV